MSASFATPPTRVLVTGAAGNIGSATTHYLVERGIAVTALSLAGPFPPEADRTVIADATSPEAFARALDDVDAVVHLAAIPHPILGTPYEVFRTNVLSTFAVLSEAGERGVKRAVIASSINALGFPLNRHLPLPAYFPFDEDMPTDPEDAYSLSKLVDETSIRMAARRWGMDIVALRFPYVGNSERLDAQAAKVRSDPARYMREGWSYLDSRDAARAIYLALTAPVSGTEVIALAAADTFLDEPTAELLARFAPAIPVRRVIEGGGSAIDTRRAEAILGFVPEHSIREQRAKTEGAAK
ncbi:MAG TPA: NAD(P)-dependent oxidoreductase [Galbitalea sp.]|nr:NAD(P)-dependent oxidoreductase [Galbitalea sp.]